MIASDVVCRSCVSQYSDGGDWCIVQQHIERGVAPSNKRGGGGGGEQEAKKEGRSRGSETQKEEREAGLQNTTERERDSLDSITQRERAWSP